MKVHVGRAQKDLLWLTFESGRHLDLKFTWEKGYLEDDPESLEIVTEKAGFFYAYSEHDVCPGWLDHKEYSKVKAFLNSLQREIPRAQLPWDTIHDIKDLDPVSYEAWTTSRQMFIDLGRELFAKFGMDYDAVDYGDDVDKCMDKCMSTTIEI